MGRVAKPLLCRRRERQHVGLAGPLDQLDLAVAAQRPLTASRCTAPWWLSRDPIAPGPNGRRNMKGLRCVRAGSSTLRSEGFGMGFSRGCREGRQARQERASMGPPHAGRAMLRVLRRPNEAPVGQTGPRPRSPLGRRPGGQVYSAASRAARPA
jgi:hypothetical protein